jgi:acyl-CoA synthetase (AMP-forming)/AMP-acid ligase II
MVAEGEGKRGDLELGTIPRLIRSSARCFGDAPAIEDGAVTLTFRTLADRAHEASRALMALGISAGDRIAVWAPNTWEWVVAALAIHSAGAVLVPINTRFKGAEAAYVLARARACALVTTTGFLDIDYVALLRQAGTPLPNLRSILVLRGQAPSGTQSWREFLAGSEQVSSDQAEARALSVTPGDDCDILFTSGTTGHPKAVPCTHAQTLRIFRDWCDIVGLRARDRYLVALPFFHSFGYKAGWLACLMMGATVLPQSVFDAGAVLSRIARDRITVLPGPPTLYQSILAHPDLDKHDLSSLRLAVTGAAVIPVELIHRMRRELTFETIITGYGLTEASGVVTMCRPDDDPRIIAATSGRAIPGVEVRVAGDGGQELPRGEPGEILTRGYHVMRGYLDDPDETAAAIDPGGWLHTGDIGTMDESGYLSITDRKKDMFIAGGFNVYPAEIENTLLGHPAIARAAVIGIPDERLGEVAMAFIVLRPGAALSAEDLILWIRPQLANYKIPRKVEFVPDLPTSATGKVLKHELRNHIARSHEPARG